jgi:long-chain fatty acid transport protein
VHFLWSHFDQIFLDFENDALDQTIEQNYKDIWQLRFGLDIDLMPSLKGMLGYVHDNTPQPIASMSPLLPDSDREDFSVGLMWHNDKWNITGTYMAVNFHARSNVVEGQVVRNEETQPAGTYDSVANIFGIGVGYKF